MAYIKTLSDGSEVLVNKTKAGTTVSPYGNSGRAPIKKNVVAKGNVDQATANSQGLLTRSQVTQDLRESAASYGVLPSQQQTQVQRTQSSLVAPTARKEELDQRARGLAGGSVNASATAQAKFAKSQAELKAKQDAAFGQFKQSQIGSATGGISDAQMNEYFNTGKGLSADPELAALQKKVLAGGKGSGLNTAALQEIDDLYRTKFEQTDEFKAFAAEQEQFASGESDFLAKETRNAAFGGQGKLQEIERELGLVEGQKLIQNPATGRFEVQGDRPDDVQIDPFLRAEERLEQQRQDGYSAINERYDNTLSQLKGERDIYGRVSTQQKNRIARLIRQKKDETDKLEQSVNNSREDMIINEQSRQKSIEDALKSEDKSLSEQINDDLLDRYNEKIEKGLASDLVEAKALVNKEIALMGDDPKARENISMWENMLQRGQVDTGNQVQTFQQAYDLTGDTEKAFNLLKATGNTTVANEFRAAWTEQKYGTEAMTREQALDRQLGMFSGEEEDPNAVMAFVKESETQFPKSFIARQLDNIANSDLASQSVKNTAQDFLDSEYNKFLDKPEEQESLVTLKSTLETRPDLYDGLTAGQKTELLNSGFVPKKEGASALTFQQQIDIPAIGKMMYGTKISDSETDRIQAIVSSEEGSKLDRFGLIQRVLGFDVTENKDLGEALANQIMAVSTEEGLAGFDMLGLARLLNTGNTAGAVRKVENYSNAIAKNTEGNNFISEAFVGANIRKYNTIETEIEEMGDDLGLGLIEGSISQWLGRAKPEEQKVIAGKMSAAVAKMRNDLLGSAVTPAEEAFLSDVLPKETDTPEVIAAKLDTLKDNALIELNSMRSVYGMPELSEASILDKSLKESAYSEMIKGFTTQESSMNFESIREQSLRLDQTSQVKFNNYLETQTDEVQGLIERYGDGATPEKVIEYLDGLGKNSPAETGQTNTGFSPVTKEFSGRSVTLEPETMTAFEQANKDFKKEFGTDIKIGAVDTSSTRTQEQQFALYGKGRTADQLKSAGVPVEYADPDSNIVTQTTNSRHMSGKAIDLFPFEIEVNGKKYEGKSYAALVKPFLEKYGIKQDTAGIGDYVNFERTT